MNKNLFIILSHQTYNPAALRGAAYRGDLKMCQWLAKHFSLAMKAAKDGCSFGVRMWLQNNVFFDQE